MSTNTSCKSCCFSKTANNIDNCKFGIIDKIKDTKKIEIKDNYNYVYDYSCKYGFSSKYLEQNSDLFKDINLEEYIKQKQLLSYYLIIDHRSDIPIEQIIDNINKLNINPQFISIMLYESNIKPIVDSLNNKLNKNLKWKTHNFLDKETPIGLAIKTILDTKKDINNIQYLWILDSKHLSRMIDNNTIENIHKIITLDQPVCNMLAVKDIDPIYGIVINTQTYQYITKNFHQLLDEGIKLIPNLNITYYA